MELISRESSRESSEDGVMVSFRVSLLPVACRVRFQVREFSFKVPYRTVLTQELVLALALESTPLSNTVHRFAS